MKIRLEDVIAPYTTNDFFGAIYEKKWEFFSERGHSEFENLFTFEDLEEYLFIARPWDSNRQEFRCAKYPDKSFEPNVNSVEEALELYGQGYTLIIDAVHLRSEKIAKVCAQLSNEFFCRVQANIYVTPAGQQGFEAHFDSHDVFVVQTEGKKKWTLNSRPEQGVMMLGDRHYNEYETIDCDSYVKDGTSVILNSGQRLYIPRGTVHKVEASEDAPSLHITFSLFPITWNRLLEFAITDGAIKTPEILETVPDNVLFDLDSQSAREQIKEKLHKAIDAADIGSLWRFLYERDTVLLPGKGISSALNADSITLNTAIKLRDNSEIFICGHKEKVWVNFARRKYGIPSHTVPFFEFMADNPSFNVKDLPGGEELLESKVIICQWLIKHGLAVIQN